MGELSLLFKALSEPVRLRIVRLLLDHGREAYGEELAAALGIPPYQLSRHLKVLRTTGLIHERREGRWVYYSVAKHNGDRLGALCRLIADAKAPGGRTVRWHGKTLKRRTGNGSARPARRGLRAMVEQDGFNWDQGPAVPGVL